jgi:hypothetical protein
MRARSWMAALALIGGTSILIGRGLSAQGPGAAQKPGQSKDREKPQEMPSQPDAPKPKAKTSDSHFARVQLNLVIAGLGNAGCDVDVKPANAGCKFRVSSPQHIAQAGQAKLDLKDVEIRGADHTCTVAITIREPGQPPKTVYRGFRLTNQRTTPSATSSSIPSLNCYLSSRLAEVDKPRTRR